MLACFHCHPPRPFSRTAKAFFVVFPSSVLSSFPPASFIGLCRLLFRLSPHPLLLCCDYHTRRQSSHPQLSHRPRMRQHLTGGATRQTTPFSVVPPFLPARSRPCWRLPAKLSPALLFWQAFLPSSFRTPSTAPPFPKKTMGRRRKKEDFLLPSTLLVPLRYTIPPPFHPSLLLLLLLFRQSATAPPSTFFLPPQVSPPLFSTVLPSSRFPAGLNFPLPSPSSTTDGTDKRSSRLVTVIRSLEERERKEEGRALPRCQKNNLVHPAVLRV